MAKNEQDQLVSQMWGFGVFQGVMAILFGIAALFWPGITVFTLVILFAIYAIVWGIADLIRGLMGIGKVHLWWLEVIFSILTIGLGVFLLRNTLVGLGVFILLVGFTFVVRGLIDIVSAFFSDDEAIRSARGLYIVGGLLGILAGIIVLSSPVSAGIAFVWIVGLYAIFQGSIAIALSLKGRALASS